MNKDRTWKAFALFTLTLLLLASLAIAGEKDNSKQINGCICDVDKLGNRLKVNPWNEDKKIWEPNAAEWFSYDNKTSISAENKLTIADLNAGKVIQTYHFLGIQGGKLAGKPFEIKELSGLIGRRTTLHWVEMKGKRFAQTIALPYLFGGETMPAYVGSEGASLAGVDNCPCK
jgi:hypothetical protein